MNQPQLTPALSPQEYRVFCIAQALLTSSSKKDMSGRVLKYLSGELMPITFTASPSELRRAMPLSLPPDTVIGIGWRLN
jgi:hypothetical protein